MLLPIVPPSAAPRVTPGTFFTALCSEVTPCDCISALLMMVIDCGMSCGSPPSRSRDAGGGWKSSLGRVPVTVVVCIVAAGAVLGSPGLFSVVGDCACCALLSCAMAPG